MKTIIHLFSFLFVCTLSAQEVDIEIFADGFDSPLALKTTGVPGDDRFFVVEQGGKIKILYPDGTVDPEPFLDISDQISSGGERGLLGLAFHPDFGSNGFLYVDYTDENGDTQVSRFTVDGADPNEVNEGSELQLLHIDQPFSNHNGGHLAFGPEGYLFIATGDGGSGGDPGNRAQDLGVLLGKILRIDVDNPSVASNYGIPPTNPFVDDPEALDEIWAYGLRNPWRFSFDLEGGNIWIGDVGQGSVEEIDRSPISAAGLNYGWHCYEGSQAFEPGDCSTEDELTFPFAEYSSATGSGNCSITGGYVYRGSVYTDIYGLYFFADYCSGMIATVDSAGNIVDYGDFSGNWVSFGEDQAGELYIVDIIGGGIYKILGGEMSTEDFKKNGSINMFPNPATEKVFFQIENAKLAKITLFDLKGKTVFSTGGDSSKIQKAIPVSNLGTGVYLVEIITENQTIIVKKLVICNL